MSRLGLGFSLIKYTTLNFNQKQTNNIYIQRVKHSSDRLHVLPQEVESKLHANHSFQLLRLRVKHLDPTTLFWQLQTTEEHKKAVLRNDIQKAKVCTFDVWPNTLCKLQFVCLHATSITPKSILTILYKLGSWITLPLSCSNSPSTHLGFLNPYSAILPWPLQLATYNSKAK